MTRRKKLRTESPLRIFFYCTVIFLSFKVEWEPWHIPWASINRDFASGYIKGENFSNNLEHGEQHISLKVFVTLYLPKYMRFCW